MNMTRRGFLGAVLGAVAAPAVVKAENLMKIFVPPEKRIITELPQSYLAHLAGDFDGDAYCFTTQDGGEVWTSFSIKRNNRIFVDHRGRPLGPSPSPVFQGRDPISIINPGSPFY